MNDCEESVHITFEDFKIGRLEYGTGVPKYNLRTPPEVKIKLLNSKQAYNSIVERNRARTALAGNLTNLIETVEFQAQSLTAADKREFREAFAELLKEI